MAGAFLVADFNVIFRDARHTARHFCGLLRTTCGLSSRNCARIMGAISSGQILDDPTSRGRSRVLRPRSDVTVAVVAGGRKAIYSHFQPGLPPAKMPRTDLTAKRHSCTHINADPPSPNRHVKRTRSALSKTSNEGSLPMGAQNVRKKKCASGNRGQLPTSDKKRSLPTLAPGLGGDPDLHSRLPAILPPLLIPSSLRKNRTLNTSGSENVRIFLSRTCATLKNGSGSVEQHYIVAT